jgi:hypothetical protein
MADALPDTLSNSESDELAMLALQKRVLRKTDMVVLPMVNDPLLHSRISQAYSCGRIDVLRLLFPM